MAVLGMTPIRAFYSRTSDSVSRAALASELRVWSVAPLRMLMPFVFILGMSGCASMFHKTPPPPTYEQLMSAAESKVAQKDVEAALAGFQEAAAADPSRAEPWEHCAQLQFDSGDYGRAIVAAKEALKRDPESWLADSVLTVSGLRVAVESLSRLHDKADITGEVRTEAELLAQGLRSTLGEDILVPNVEAQAGRSRKVRRSSSRTAPPSRPVPAPTQAPDMDAIDDPFSVLKQPDLN